MVAQALEAHSCFLQLSLLTRQVEPFEDFAGEQFASMHIVSTHICPLGLAVVAADLTPQECLPAFLGIAVNNRSGCTKKSC